MGRLSDEDFVTFWNASGSRADLARQLGIDDLQALSARAYRLRRAGWFLHNKNDLIDREHRQAIGAKGGRNGRTGGFYGRPELARRAGKLGGRVSKRQPSA